MTTKNATDLQIDAWMAFHQIRLAILPPLVKHLSDKCGLTEAEYQVFIGIHSAPDGAIRPTDLAEKIGWEHGRLSHQIARMQTKGLLDRKQCPVDARSCYIGMTKKGQALINKALPLQLNEVKRLFGSALTNDQLRALIEISNAITTYVQEINLTSKKVGK